MGWLDGKDHLDEIYEFLFYTESQSSWSNAGGNGVRGGSSGADGVTVYGGVDAYADGCGTGGGAPTATISGAGSRGPRSRSYIRSRSTCSKTHNTGYGRRLRLKG